ncbi:Cullin-1 [Smittium mucronatum]|uniref:Cullin-1 n=1 Tax=Smittium mucronatum TaxID=133383 RepID=A0A1R0GYU4_9FUNG|nr:Cullin-1 [Smittium mucronatum]OLY84394.1 Cullin-1 [Smittium mucronatum]
MAESTVLEYMRKVSSTLDVENSRVKNILELQSYQKYVFSIENVLIKDEQLYIESGFAQILDSYVIDDIKLCYLLLSRFPDSLVGIQSIFQTKVKEYGLSQLDGLTHSKDHPVESSVFVEKIFEIYNRFNNVFVDSFSYDPIFSKALDCACRDFINHNSISSNSSTKVSELLSKYIDSLLKKGSKIADESQSESKLNMSITILRYIEDRDAFQDFYRRNLARRLVNDQSSSFNSEQSMISKLKEICGFDFTNKLTRMFNDIDLNNDLNSLFNESSVPDKNIDFSAKILNTAAWPLSYSKSDLILPRNLTSVVDSYTQFYNSRHQGRVLNWLWQYSKLDIKFTPPQKGSQPSPTYIFTVSTSQYAILSLFDSSMQDVIAYSQISKATGLSNHAIDSSLAIFAKCKLIKIINDQNESSSSTSITQNSSFSINNDFRSKRLKINLNVPMKSESKKESVEALKYIQEDHNMTIQAAIVRIMKTQRSLKHNVLITEVISQLESRFSPKIPDIKRAIDSLLDREFIERDSTNFDIYKYVT